HVPPVNDLGVALGFHQLVALFRADLHTVARVRDDAPLLVLAPLGAGAIEVLAAGPPERRRGHLDLGAGRLEGLNVLDAPFSVAALADDDGTSVILETSGHDFAAAGAAAVDQADHGKIGESRVQVHVRSTIALLLADARANRHDQAIVHEQVADFDGAIEQTPRIETQIEDEALHDALFTEVSQDAFQLALGLVGEAGQPDIANLLGRVDDVVPAIIGFPPDAEHGFHFDGATRDIELQRAFGALALDEQLHTGAGLPLNLGYGLRERHASGSQNLRLIELLALAVHFAG